MGGKSPRNGHGVALLLALAPAKPSIIISLISIIPAVCGGQQDDQPHVKYMYCRGMHPVSMRTTITSASHTKLFKNMCF